MENKVLVKVYVPMIEDSFDLWLPVNKQIYKVILLLQKAINDLYGGYFVTKNMPMLYDRETAKIYDVNLFVGETNIKDGSELMLI